MTVLLTVKLERGSDRFGKIEKEFKPPGGFKTTYEAWQHALQILASHHEYKEANIKLRKEESNG